LKEDIRKYLENDEAIDSIDYLIELKNMYNNDKNVLSYIQMVISNIITPEYIFKKMCNIVDGYLFTEFK